MKKANKVNKTQGAEKIIHFILDASGSMQSIKRQVITGFNEYVGSLEKQKNVKFSLTTFNTNGILEPYKLINPKDVYEMDNNSYEPDGGTPLYDACVDTIEKLAEETQEKKNTAILVVIMTDGEENSSQKHDSACFADLVNKLKARGNWTFVFMGANQNAWANATKNNISTMNAYQWQATPSGTRGSYDYLRTATIAYCSAMDTKSAGGAPGEVNNLSTEEFFNKDAGGGSTE